MRLRCASIALLATAAGAEPVVPQPTFDLARDGKPACSIVLAADPTPAARLAALEIQCHVLRIADVELPIRPETEPVDGRRILVGESSATRALGLRGGDFASQEYLIAFRPEAMVLIGRDWVDTAANRRVEGRPMTGESLGSLRHRIDYWKAVGLPERSTGPVELPGLYDDQGTALAAYAFLERCGGVRWYGPTPLTVVIPKQPTLSATGGDVRRALALKHRSALPGGNWPFLRAQWGEFTTDQVRLHWRRIRQGGEPWAANHTFHAATIKSHFQDPEYQSRNPRSRGSQLCYTHPKLIQQVAQMARDYFDGRGELPAGWKAVGTYCALVPDDNMNLCTCSNCAALLGPRTARRTGFFSSGEMSDYWFTFVNAVAREVRRTHPDRFIATLAYWAYALPPGFPLEPNVSVAPCLHTCYYPVHPEIKDNDLGLYRDWLGRAKAPLFLWVYYHHPMEPALIDKWTCFPHVMVHQTAAAMRMFLRDGVRGIFECGEQDQLEQYVMTRVWDDPEVDVDRLIDEFFRLYFGPAGDPLKRFYLRLETIACDPANYPPPYHRRDGIDWRRAATERLGTAANLTELGSLMDEAGQRAIASPEKDRVALWRRAFWEWMRDGLKPAPRP
jgi:hypothetical protein